MNTLSCIFKPSKRSKTLLLRFVLTLSFFLLVACSDVETNKLSEPEITAEGIPTVDVSHRVMSGEFSLLNEEAPIPPQCYTKTEAKHNPCYVCHQRYTDRDTTYRMNYLDDGGIQGEYLFSDIGVTNHWKNLFIDKTDWVESIKDETIRSYIDEDNYSKLSNALVDDGWKGFIPDLENYNFGSDAFGADGFALDGSAWVAFNYKPLPSTFWPTNGSTDDVVLRLPEIFRSNGGVFNKEIYQLNLAILEVSFKQLSQIDIPVMDESILQLDLNQDGDITSDVAILKARTQYVGDASQVEVIAQQFPLNTELMHSVRYVGADEEGNIVVPQRMKELRYMKKIRDLNDSELQSRFARERKEKLTEELPTFNQHGDEGFSNGLGWLVQGFIENYDGDLRPQSYEEQMFCMGCHSAIGSTVDSTFSFARKVTGVAGWSYINLKGMKDAPSRTQTEGEILQYLKRSGGGHEFRENKEMFDRWYLADGTVDETKVKQADVYALITPSLDKALEMNKAYTYIVRHQSYIHGRDANTKPAKNVYEHIDESNPPLDVEFQLFDWDIQLDWP